MKLKLFTCDDHACFYPVGVASIVLAADEDDARRLLNNALVKKRLTPGDYTLVEVDMTVSQAIILQDGEY